jgi:cytochrome c-type biogenesis protein CcmF
MLLWVLILSVFGAAVWLFGSNLPLDLRATVLAIQGAISAAFVIFIVATSNPFLRIAEPPAEGLGLNPILQDPALAIHPPLLYTGYVGFSMAFSFAIAALILGRVDSAWARWVRPWTLAAWIFLAIGIGIGSWWAYYTLGWGGWWFWDSVENASLMPWLIGTALLHSAIVMEKRDSLKAWTILLAILAFSFSLLGTFIVRSGVINSVHSFASDPARGVFILVIVSVFTAGGLALFAWRASTLSAGSAFSLVSRESSLVLNNLLLVVSCGVILTGTLYPLALEALTGDKITVGPPFFNSTVVWLFMPLLLAVPFGVFLAWKRGDLKEAARQLWPAALAALAAGAAAASAGAEVKRTLAIALGTWVFAGSVWEVLWRAKFPSVSISGTARRLWNMRRSQIAATLGHIGLAVAVIGVAGASAWKAEHLTVMKPGESARLAGYVITFKGVLERDGPNYAEFAGAFELRRGERPIGTIIASKRRYEAPPRTTTQAGIAPRALGDVYVVLGDEAGGGAFSVRMEFHPFVRWIWGGALIMFIAGAVSLFDRRLRIGLPQRAAKTPLAPAPVE